MQNPEKNGGAEFAKTKDAVRGIIDRIRSIEHPDWNRKEEDIGALKTALAKYSSELEHLTFRYDARCSELAMIKGQYSELEKKFLMRPDAMRRVGEIEITELVRQKHEVAGQESALERARIELQREKEGLEREMKECSAARLAELEREYSGKSEQLRVRSENLALREKETAETEKHLKERIEAARLAAVEELSVSFAAERQAADGSFRKEKTMLSSEAETWRLRAGESVSQLAEARKRVEELEKELQGERQAAAGAAQGRRLTDMEKEALARRLEEWEKKGAELEKFRADLKAREAKCRLIEENSRKEAQSYQERVDALELELRDVKRDSDKWRLRLEEWEKKGPELERWRAEARGLGERVAELEAKLQRSEKAAAGAAALEQELAKLKEHFGKALSELAELNERLAAEKERFIKSEAQKDAERSRKMEELLAELGAKERALEEGWTRRHRTLEAEQKGYQEEFERRHSAMLEALRAGAAAAEKLYAQKEAKLLELNKRFTAEFQDREARARNVEEELRARGSALELSAAALARDYDAKTASLEELKRKFLAELSGGGEGAGQ